MKSKIVPHKPFMLLMYGYPGSGKSFFARQFADEFQNTVHVHGDKIHSEIADKMHQYNETNSAIPELVIEYLISEYLRNGISVIADLPLNKRSDRKKYRNIALTNKAEPVLVWLQIDPESAYARTKKRDRRKTEDRYAAEYTTSEFQSIISNSQNPQNEPFTVISGKHAFKSQRSAVLKKLSDLKVVNLVSANSSAVKPELVNLIPKMGDRDLLRRNISIR